MGQYEYTRERLPNGSGWNLVNLAAELKMEGIDARVDCSGTAVVVNTDVELTQEQVDTMSTKVADCKASAEIGVLPALKAKKCGEIDARTDELIAMGFEYPSSSGKMHSLSLQAQNKLNGLFALRDMPQVTYPLTYNTRDDDETIELVDSTAVVYFALTAFGTIRAHTDSGTALKDQVRAASTIAEVQAIADER